MNPTVTAAAIGVGGTVVVGVAGFWATVKNTRQTIAQARESRIWDRRADIYVEALAAIHNRAVRRAILIRLPDEPPSPRLGADLARYKGPDWHQVEIRLQAFASKAVFTAVQASSRAHYYAEDRFRSWEQAMQIFERTRSEVSAADEQRMLQKRIALEKQYREVNEKYLVAEAADDAVVELIRTELQGRSVPLGDEWEGIGRLTPPRGEE